MKILYAIQGTGNGHINRAREIIPYLQQYGQLDLLISSGDPSKQLPYLIKYKKRGIGFTFGKNGSIDLIDSIQKLKPFEFFKDIWEFPVQSYDLIINDFEPITAWACKLRKKNCVSLSHQASFLSQKTPRIDKPNWISEKILKHYAPANHYVGFHFQAYDAFIHTPVIREQIRKTGSSNKGHITVYLPAYSDDKLIKHFNKINDIEWHVFSKHSPKGYFDKNVSVQPIHNDAFVESLCSSDGLITNGGFESPAEAMYLHKKVMAIPMRNQYEQLCNAEAMKQMGVTVLNSIKEDFNQHVMQWLNYAYPINVNYYHKLPGIIEKIVSNNWELAPFKS